jgi:hypothetical protein
VVHDRDAVEYRQEPPPRTPVSVETEILGLVLRAAIVIHGNDRFTRGNSPDRS